MIVRILGEGQYDVDDDRVDELNVLDTRVQDAVEAGDGEQFAPALGELLGAVRRLGSPLADRTLTASELVLPAEGSDLNEVADLLGDEGLIPG